MTATGNALLAQRYHLHDRLGTGGHGEVWRAEDRILGRTVAVKRFLHLDGTAAQRVQREVRALQVLAVPGVVELLDVFEHEGQTHLVMALVDGEPFPGRPGPVPWARLEHTALALCEVVARVHDLGVVHRDLKPDNVLVGPDGRPTVLDFGLARGRDLGSTITRDGVFAGTPAYAAPEQLRGQRATAKADLFALGVMLYEALAGVAPWEGHDAADVWLRLTRRARPLSEAAPTVPPEVAAVVDRLLSLDPAARPETVAEVMGALGGGAPAEAARLPWLGDRTPVHRVLQRVEAGGSVTVGGAPGSGRTRVLQEVAEALQAQDRDVAWLVPGDRPLQALIATFGALSPPAASLAEALEGWTARLRAFAEAGGVVLLDGGEALDRVTARVLSALQGVLPVVTVVDTAAAADVVTGPLSAEDLAALFVGPDPVLHLREDAGAVLARRTEGVAERVVAEVGAWVRGGLARWTDDGRLAVSRADLDALRKGLSLVSPGAVWGRDVGPLREDLEDLVAWATLAGDEARIGVLAAALSTSDLEVELQLEELLAAGAARREDGDRIRPLVPAVALQRWAPGERAHAHRALADAVAGPSVAKVRHRLLAERWAQRDALSVRSNQQDATFELDGARTNAAEPSGSDGLAVLVDDLLALAGVAGEQGDLATSHAAFRLVVPLLEEVGSSAQLRRALAGWARQVLADPRPTALREVLLHFEAAPDGMELCEAQVLELALAAVEGRHEMSERMGRELIRRGALDERLEEWVQVARYRGVRFAPLSQQVECLEELESWAARRGVQAQALASAWRGLLAYRRGEYVEAAKHARSAQHPTLGPVRQLVFGTNEASAWQEAGRLDEAEEAARRVLDQAASLRLALYEGRAMWLVRSIAYRRGTDATPDLELVDAVEQGGWIDQIAKITLTESAIAWRAGRWDVAARLARRSGEAFDTIGFSDGRCLLASLERLVAREGSGDDALVDAVGQMTLPRLRLQSLALLRWAGAPVEEAMLRDALDALDPSIHPRRLEVIAPAEALGPCPVGA